MTHNKGCTMYDSLVLYLEHGSVELTHNKGCTMYVSKDLYLEHGSNK